MFLFLYDVAVVGAGTSAAYFLSTLDGNLYPNVIVIGDEDPWAGKRGRNSKDPRDPVNYINHTSHLIAHKGDKVPAQNKDMVPRDEWAKMNRAIIDKVARKFVPQRVRMISEVTLPADLQFGKDRNKKGFKLITQGGDRYYAKKVVVAAGAGGHTVPAEALQARSANSNLILDMDEFANLAGKIANPATKTIVILGPNAAVDSADTAGFQGFQVKWLMKQEMKDKTLTEQKPAFLATGHQVYAEKNVNGNVERILFKAGSLSITANPFDVTVRFKDANDKPLVIQASYFVYGVGQNQTKQEQGQFLSFIDSEIQKKLEPIYDKDQHFGPAHENVLGFQMQGTNRQEGFEMVGAMCGQVIKCRDIQHTYLRDLEGRIKEIQDKILSANSALTEEDRIFLGKKPGDYDCMNMDQFQVDLADTLSRTKVNAPSWIHIISAFCHLLLNYKTAAEYLKKPIVQASEMDPYIKKTLTPSVMQQAQLTAIAEGVSALNAHMPQYVAKGQKGGQAEVNFSRDNQTTLRAYISVRFPFVSEQDARTIIDKIIEGRKSKPYGYTEEDVKGFNDCLANRNNMTFSVLAVPKTSGSGQTQFV